MQRKVALYMACLSEWVGIIPGFLANYCHMFLPLIT